MSMVAPSLSYLNQATTAGVQVGTAGPRGLYGIISTVTGGAVTIYDGTSTGGVILFTKTLAVGDIIHFGGLGIRAKNGLFLVVGAGTVNVIYS
jgi:hypothetical protein